MKLPILGSTVLAAMCCSAAFADLTPIGVIPASGAGLGAVLTSVTFQNTGTESGCVGANPAGTAVPGGAFVGAAECPVGITGGNEKTGNAQANIYTATQLGIQPGNVNGFSFDNLVLLFNGSQDQSSPNIMLDNLALDLFSSSGALLQSFPLTSPQPLEPFPGVGNAGFGFQLNSTEATTANTILASNPGLFIATAATATLANGGQETISLATLASPVPEPSEAVTVSAALLLMMFVVGRRRTRAPFRN